MSFLEETFWEEILKLVNKIKGENMTVTWDQPQPTPVPYSQVQSGQYYQVASGGQFQNAVVVNGAEGMIVLYDPSADIASTKASLMYIPITVGKIILQF